MVKGFCPLNVKITRFPDGFPLNIYCNCWTIKNNCQTSKPV